MDTDLLPTRDWRKAVSLASTKQNVLQWSESNGELDDPVFIDELRTKVLPQHGISAHSDEILVVSSMRQALQFLVQLLATAQTEVLIEEPADPELLVVLKNRGVNIRPLSKENLGQPAAGTIAIVNSRSGTPLGCDPGAADLFAAVERQHGFLIELVSPADTCEKGASVPALRAVTSSGHLIHIGRMAPSASCGSPAAFIVSNAVITNQLRRLRRASGALPNLMLQRSWAYFLSMGHYASALQRSRQVLDLRKTALRDALNHYLHTEVEIRSTPGVAAYWVYYRGNRSAETLASQAASSGVLIKPARLHGKTGAFQMSVTGIPKERIRAGVQTLAQVFRANQANDQTAASPAKTLPASAIRRAIAGKTLLYNTVYGEPCTIRVRRTGELAGVAGYANDDLDKGRWWIEDRRWFRQWNHWAYGEAEGFFITVSNSHIYWHNEDGHVVDQAIILRRPGRAKTL